MKRRILIILFILFVAGFAVAEEGQEIYEPGQLLVRFAEVGGQLPDPATKASILNSLLECSSCSPVVKEYNSVPGLTLVELPAEKSVLEAISLLNQSSSILYAEPNYKVKLAAIPNDPRFGELWGMHNEGQTGGTPDADIDAPEAWDLGTGSDQIIVAVTDTGIDYTHPDLAPNMWINEAELNGTPGTDDDNNGYVDDIYGYDFYNRDGDPIDDHFHGTHVAGTIGAVGNNNIGVTGVCWTVKLMAVKFIDLLGGGNLSDGISAIEYSTENGANIINASWSFDFTSQSLDDAVEAAGDAGVLLVAAATNDSTDNDMIPRYPANCDYDNVISVMATDHDDARSLFSNYGATTVDLGAPGTDILSTFPTYDTFMILFAGFSRDYEIISGTSMAAPHVAGACALMWAIDPDLTYIEIKNILMQTVDPTLPGFCVSGGRLNLYTAAYAVAIDSTPPRPDPAEWEIDPAATGLYTIAMEAKEATDKNGVEYYFECVNDSDFNSPGWQDSPLYVATGLDEGTMYSFRTKTRDKAPSQNETGWSDALSATTDSVTDTSPPFPDPTLWDIKPLIRKLVPQPSILRMVAKAAFDENGVEYYFEETTGTGLSSGWQDGKIWDVSSPLFVIGNTYSFRVKARDKSAAQNETGWSTTESVALVPPPRRFRVPEPYATIQAAIDAASNGDIVIVSPYPIAPYTYRGNGNRDLDFKGKAITVKSREPEDESIVAITVIDCQGIPDGNYPHRAFDFHSGEHSDSVLAGITMINGYWRGMPGLDATTPGTNGGNGANALGGAIKCSNGSSPTIRNCVIADCTAEGGNGGDGSDGYNGVPGTPGDPTDPNSPFVPPIAPTPGGNGGNSGVALGGGIYCSATSSPIIEGCTIRDCNAIGGRPGNAGDGGDGSDGLPNPGFTDFPPFHGGNGANGGNATNVFGGAIYCAAGSSAVIRDCTITDNNSISLYFGAFGSGGAGGTGIPGVQPDAPDGIDGSRGHTYAAGGGAYYGMGNGTADISGTTFTGNEVDGDGGAVYLGWSNNMSAKITDCLMEYNLTDIYDNGSDFGDGAGVWYDHGGTLMIDDCNISRNFARGAGGGVYGGDEQAAALSATVDINSSSFSGNVAPFGGGAIYLDQATLTLTDTTITRNMSTEGGGLNGYWCVTDVNNCTFKSNLAMGGDGLGGGIVYIETWGKINNCVMIDNYAEEYGGAMYFEGIKDGKPQELTNCLIADNAARVEGAGLSCNESAETVMTNCTVVNNSVYALDGSGGGVSCRELGAWVEIISSILWNNSAANGPQIAVGTPRGSDFAGVDVWYSDIQGGESNVFEEDPAYSAVYWFTGNIDQDPMFITTAAGTNIFDQTYYLSQYQAGQILDPFGNIVDPDVNPEDANSPCIDAGLGDANALAASVGFPVTTRTDHIADDGLVNMGYHYEADIQIPPRQYRLIIMVVDAGYGTNGRLLAKAGGTTDPFSMEAPDTRLVNQGTVVQLNAIPVYDVNDPNNRYRVKQWTGADGVPFLNPADPNNNIVTMNSDKIVTVEFQTTRPSLTISVIGNGTTIPVPNVTHVYDWMTKVDLEAIPDNPSEAIIWSGTYDDYSTSRYNMVIMDDYKHVDVEFYSPQTHFVGPDWTALQRAIYDAHDRDILIIDPGTYSYEPAWHPDGCTLEIDGKAITIVSSDPDDLSAVTIDGRFVMSNVGRNTIIDGLTIINSDVHYWFMTDPQGSGVDGAPGIGMAGGGMELVDDASPTVLNCVFNGCYIVGAHGANGNGGLDARGSPGNGGWAGWAHGGAVAIGDGGSPVFKNCAFVNCFANGGDGGNGGSGTWGGHGGNWSEKDYWDERSWIWDYGPFEPYWKYSGYGGAIYCGDNSSPEFENCMFIGNNTYGGSCGVSGFPLMATWPTQHYKIDSFGGAVYMAQNSSASFTDCDFIGNEADIAGPNTHVKDDLVPINYDPYISFGGAIAFEDDARPTFERCSFSNNTSTIGGAMWWRWADSMIVDCNFVDNSAYHGGGVLFVGNTSEIGQSVFSGNNAFFPLAQGGAICSLGANAEIVDCEINNNDANGFGGGIYVSSKYLDGDDISDGNDDTVLIQNCLITGNTAARSGGGISANWHSDPNIVNCTIAENTAINVGGGVRCYYGNYTRITNSILWDNLANTGPQAYVGTSSVQDPRPSTLSVKYSDVQGGQAAIYVDTHPTDPFYNCRLNWDDITDPNYPTNINSNPLFIAGPLGDYYLNQGNAEPSQNSPCVDRGWGDISILGLGYTTRTDHVEDSCDIDIGYHYNPRAPTDLHDLTLEVMGGHGRLYAERIGGIGDPNTFTTRGVLNLYAVPDVDYVVEVWTGADNITTTSTRNIVTMDVDKTVTVEFKYRPPRNIMVGTGQEFETIAPAVAAAYDKDTIVLQPDTYTGPQNVDIDFQGKAITIKSMYPDDPCYVAETIIDCAGAEIQIPGQGIDQNHRGFIFQSGEGPDSVLAGLTITNGYIVGDYGFIYLDPNGMYDPNFPDGLDASGDGYGGGILIINGSSPTIEKCVITNCVVTGGYGGHGVHGGIDTVNNDDGIPGGNGGTGSGSGYGGAIYCDTTCSPTIIDCNFIGNRASGGVGGDGGNGGSPILFGLGGNESSGGSGGFAYGFGYGGGIYFDQQAKPIIEDCQFIDNVATGGVGGLFGKLGMGEPTNPRSTDGIFGYGFDPVYGPDGTFGTGGGIYYAQGCEADVRNTNFTGNVAYNIYYGYLPIGLYESLFRDLETYYQGGGIYDRADGAIRLEGCDFVDNLGGGLYCVFNIEDVNIANCDFTGNIATLNGGGVYIGPNCNGVTFNKCDFRTNSSDSSGDLGSGGGGLNCKSDVTLSYCSFSANTAVGYGGGINCYRDVDSTLELKLDNCSFANNSSAVGGAAYWKNFDAELIDCYIIGNTAGDGGGLALVDGSVKMDGGAINNNTATAVNADGGGMSCIRVTGTIANYTFCDNNASGYGGSGGAINFTSNGAPKVINCLFESNLAKSDGGAIGAYLGATPVITNSTFTENWADNSGGGIFGDWESSATIFDCIFNKCYNYAIYIYSTNGDTCVGYNLFYDNPHGALYKNRSGMPPVDWTDTQIEGIYYNIGNRNPLFVYGPLGGYYLSQIAAGQSKNSPAWNAGSDLAGNIEVVDGNDHMSDYTTHIDNILDSGDVDIGYHYVDAATLSKYEVTARVVGGSGTVKIDLDPNSNDHRYYAYPGTVVTITATPRTGWRIKAWSGTDDDSSTDKTNTVVIRPSAEVIKITVEFEQTNTFTVAIGGDYSNIQDAIYDAKDGDTIIVYSGIYFGPQIQVNKSITIRSEDPDDPNGTVIDFTGHAGPIFAFGPDCDADTILNGFTIQNSTWYTATGADGEDPGENGADGPGAEGGAIHISRGAGPVIKNCVIRDNRILGGFGGHGITADNTHNAGRGGWGGWARGGGVYCGTNSSPTFINCQIIDNWAVGGWGGNGGDQSLPGRANYGGNWSKPNWWNRDPRNLNVELVLGQHLWEKWTEMAQPPNETLELSYYYIDLLGYEMSYPPPVALAGDFMFFGYFGDYRWYGGYGGGVFCNTGSNVTFIDCTVSGNLAQGGLSGLGGNEPGAGPLRVEPYPEKYELQAFGGGIYCATDATIKFTNCTIENNTASDPTYDHRPDALAHNQGDRIPPNYDPNDTYRIDQYLGHGGGVCAEDTAVVEFIGCTFSGNAAAVGGALNWDEANLKVSDCEFISNTAYQGGGLFGQHGPATIIDSRILSNNAVPDPNDPNDIVRAGGGGLHLRASEAEIINCEISNNQAYANGGGVYVGGENSPSLTNCLITNNIAGYSGGGISVNILAQLSVFNCTVADNEATASAFNTSYGGGLSCYDGAYTDIIDSIFWGNAARNGLQMAVRTGDEEGPAEIRIDYSDVKGGGAPPAVYVDIADPLNGDDDSILNWGLHNLPGTPSAWNPLFVTGFGGDYYLSQPYVLPADPTQTSLGLSACVDMGSAPANDLNDANSLDMYRHTTRTDRRVDAGTIDIGYHYLLTADIIGDYDFDGDVDIVDLGIFMLHWLEDDCDFPDWCQGTDLNKDGVVNFIDEAIFADNYGEVERTAPLPDPMIWALAPISSGQDSINMAATRAFDNSGYPVQYQFGCFYINGNFSGSDPFYDSGWLDPYNAAGWQNRATLTWQDAGLAPGVEYGYRVRARDVKRDNSNNIDPVLSTPTEWSVIGYAITGTPPPDTTPPTPNPMTWNMGPTATTWNTIIMSPSVATDDSGIEYYIEDPNFPQFNSGWLDPDVNVGWRDMANLVWEDTAVAAGVTYYYRVKARDKSDNRNETGWSPILSATAGQPPDLLPPLPDPPLGWLVWPMIDPATNWHYMVALVADDATTGGNNPVEYYFECVAGSGIDSGWQLSNIYTYFHTSPAYYRWKARDAVGNETAWSPAGYTGT